HRRAARRVLLERPWIALEVVAAVELDRVHEDRDDDARRPPPRLRDERDVPVVKGAHRRPERDAPPRPAPPAGPPPHRPGITDRLHHPTAFAAGLNACASEGNAPPFTSSTYALAARTTSRPTSA